MSAKILHSRPRGPGPQRRGLFRRVRRQVHPRGAGRRRGRGRRRVREGQGRPRLRRRARTTCWPTTPAVRARSPRCRGSPSTPAAHGCSSSARTSTTPARTRSTTCSGQALLTTADGQDPRHRRDRRRPARRGHRHRLRAVRPRMHHLHGRDRHRAAGAQRGPDADARRRGHPREVRQPHPQGRHQRGVPRLGRQRGPHALPLRHRRRARTPSPPWCATSTASSASRPAVRSWSAPAACPTPSLACVGGGSNAIGLFHAFLPDTGRTPLGCEAAGHGVETGEHAATLTAGEPGILHGSRSYVLQDEEGQITEPYSISAGLDYPGIGPEHAYLQGHRPRRVPPGHRRRGDAGAAAALAHRGHHPGHRERARAGGRAGARHANSARTG